jgi:cytochrome c biogenesis protein CcdA/thiol-disulfide isomerase/thioredoxin
VLLLVIYGLIAGVGTALSPCVLPVLPILLAGGATGRKPVRIVGGLVLSFSLFTLFATWLLDKLGLPQDFLRNLAIGFLFLMAAVLLLPPLAQLIERALSVFSRLRPAGSSGGFLMGITLGLVFVPCAGPFLAAIATAAARDHFGFRSVVAAFSYGIGAGIPMLAIAIGGRGIAARVRQKAVLVRNVSGVLVAAIALGLVFHLDDHLTQISLPWTSYIQNHVEKSTSAQKQERKVSGERAALAPKATVAGSNLPDYGAAPAILADGAWINSQPLDLSKLHGKVVLLDFWTYSCINCLRTLPHLKSWYAAYHAKGLDIIGVHTPEFAFEHVTSNVEAAVKRLGIPYPVVQDNKYRTWDGYANEYWPAEYLIDQKGDVRYTSFGEGDYDQTQNAIRDLLGDSGVEARSVPNLTPTEFQTPESYLGYARLARYTGSKIVPNHGANYTFAKSLPLNGLTYAGNWTVGGEYITAGQGAALRLHFQADNIYIVLGGSGTVQELIDGKPIGKLDVNSFRLYTVLAGKISRNGVLELRFSPGVRAYSFTFG